MNVLRAASERVGAKVGLDPILIATAIMAIVQLLTSCMGDEPTPNEIAKAAKHPTWRQQRRMEREVWRELWDAHQEAKFNSTMAAIHSEIHGLSTADIGQVCNDCGAGLTGDFGD